MSVVHWNPVAGCAIASPGCSMCAAMRAGGPMTVDTATGPAWTGRVQLDESALGLPFALAPGSTVCVCSRSDLFYEAIPEEWIDRILSVIEASPQLIFQILTKRVARLRRYGEERGGFPANVALGVSAERQQEAAERIPELLAAPAASRFVMFYPLLGPIDLTTILQAAGYAAGAIGLAGIGEEAERPYDRAWLTALMGELTAWRIPAIAVRPDAWAFAPPGRAPKGVSTLGAFA